MWRVLIWKPNVGDTVSLELSHLLSTLDLPALSSPLGKNKYTRFLLILCLQNYYAIFTLLRLFLANNCSQAHLSIARAGMQSVMRRFFSSAKSNVTPFKEQLKRMLNPPKVTDGFIADKEAPIHLTLRNGISHFSLPLHRLVFNYCPHNGDSRPLM